jgi:hypothetical protein
MVWTVNGSQGWCPSQSDSWCVKFTPRREVRKRCKFNDAKVELESKRRNRGSGRDFPDETVHIAGFFVGMFVLDLYVVVTVKLVFSYHLLFGLPRLDMPVVLFHPGLSRKVGLSDIVYICLHSTMYVLGI